MSYLSGIGRFRLPTVSFRATGPPSCRVQSLADLRDTPDSFTWLPPPYLYFTRLLILSTAALASLLTA